MINTKKYAEAASEVIDIFQHMDDAMIENIPIEVIKKLNENKSTNYIPNIEFDEDGIKNIMPETRALLAVIYNEYLSNDEEKAEFNEIFIKNQKDLNEKYKIKAFEKNEDKIQTEKLPTVIKESFWKKIINKLRKK